MGEAGKKVKDVKPGSGSRGTQFVHLHLHTEYSLLDGGNRIDRLVKRVAELGMKACAITDHGNIFGAVSFYQACKDKGIKPILGVEAYVTPPGKPRSDRTYSGGGEGGYHLVLLAMNNVGWANLLKLCSEAYLTGFYYKPRIDRELLAIHSEGLIAINGHLGSEIGEHLLAFQRSGDQKYWELARESAEWHKAAFGGATGGVSHVADRLSRFYIELQHHVPEQNAINPLLIRLARQVGCPLVCDNDAHFLNEEDHDAHDTLICISTGKGKNDENRLRYPRDVYVKSPEEMRELFEQYGEAGEEALANCARIAEACEVKLAVGENHAPLVRVRRKRDGETEQGEAAEWQSGKVAKWEERKSPPRDGENAGRQANPTLALAPNAEGARGERSGEWDRLPQSNDPKFGGDLTAWYQAYCAEFEVVPFRVPEGASEAERTLLLAHAKSECDAALRRLAQAGFLWRYADTKRLKVGEQNGSTTDERWERLERELKILAAKGISAYFLIVWDFVNWGRQNGVPALARGSGVGTMVGFALGLSNACPVRYGLLFERFTDPDRSEFPDIDIDLCQDGRGRVIDYVRRKYGHVAQIITFGTLGAKAALRDVGRVLGVPLGEVDRLCKLVPAQLNITLEEALRQEPEFKKARDTNPAHRQLIDSAILLEGHTRHAGVHAAGVIVATRPLDEVVPLYKPPGNEDNAIVTQWDGPTCEKMGLLKMDFLGLRTISVIERAKRLIRETLREEEIWGAVGRDKRKATSDTPVADRLSHVAHPLDLDRLTYDDQKVFELFRRGETTGVFQFESGGMRRLLTEMKPDRLEDLIAANALFRPGPMDLIPEYNRRKHGTEEAPKVHEIVDRFTAETYGVMVYQEQVMRIVHGLGGISLRDAYSLIKNISKKRHDKIEKERPKFIEGAVQQGLTRPRADDLFELILKFAGYGFNKSHSCGYAIVAYQTAYLKTYFPNQYMAAFLTYESQAGKASEWIPYLEDCRRTRVIDPCTGATIKTGVEVRPPDINLSQADFSVVGAPGGEERHVRFGLKAIKGTGDRAIETIIAERERGGAFTSLFDFCERVPPGVLNKVTLESLIKCGAFDGVHGREQRAAMLASIEQAMGAGQSLAADRAAGQGGLFGGGGAKAGPAVPAAGGIPLAKVSPWSETQTLAYEKEVLGFYISSHPLDKWKFWTQLFATTNAGGVKECATDARVVLAAMVQSVRAVVVRNGRSAGQRMAIVTVEDTSGACDCVMFTDCFAKFGHLAQAEGVVFVLGRVDRSRGDAQIVVDRLVPVEGVPLEPGRLRLFMDVEKTNGGGERVISRVAELLRGGPAPANRTSGSGHDDAAGAAVFPVDMVIATEEQVAVLALDTKIRVRLEHPLAQGLDEALGSGMVKVVGGVTIERDGGKGDRPWQRRGNGAGA